MDYADTGFSVHLFFFIAVDWFDRGVELLHLLYILFNKLYSELRGIRSYHSFFPSFAKLLRGGLYSLRQFLPLSFSVLNYLPCDLHQTPWRHHSLPYSFLNKLTPWPFHHSMFLFALIRKIMHMSLKAKAKYYKICIMGLDLLHKTWVQEIILHLVLLSQVKSGDETSLVMVDGNAVCLFYSLPNRVCQGHGARHPASLTPHG